MRRLLLAVMLLIATTSAVRAETIIATVNGLVCAFCATGIAKTFKAQPAVDTVKVDLDSKLVTINTKPDQTLDDATITTLLTNSGYTVTNIARKN